MAELWHAHPDGYLRRIGTGALGPAWQAQARLTREQRAALVPKTYLPDDTTNGTLVAPAALGGTRVPTSGDTVTMAAGAAWSNEVIWGRIQLPRAGAAGSPVASMENVAIAGPDPRLITPGATFEVIKNSDTNSSPVAGDDVLIDPMLWTDPAMDPPGGPCTVQQVLEAYINSIGIRGGFLTLRNPLIRNVQDAWQFQQPRSGSMTSVIAPLMEAALYYRGPLHPSQPEGTHSDFLQLQIGRGFLCVGGLLGGPYDPVGYAATPGKNTGKDCANQAVIVKQESRSSDPTNRTLDDIEIDSVIIWHVGRDASDGGPTFAVNAVVSDGNTYPGLSVHDTLFVDTTGHKDVIRSSTLSSRFSNNRRISVPVDGTWTDLGAISYANGA